MKVRKKIILSNITAIFLTGFIMILLFIILSLSFRNLTGISFKTIRYQKYDIKNIEKNLDMFISNIEYAQNKEKRERHIGEFQKNISSAGYRMKVIENDRVISSNFRDEDIIFLERIKYDEKSYSQNNTLKIEGRNIVKRTAYFNDGDSETFILIGEAGRVPAVDVDLTLERFVSYTVLFLVVSLCLLFITNILLAGYLSSYILNPLNRLKYGTEKIREGEYGYTIYYPEDDEFGDVIREFNDMKDKLKASEKQKELYEKDRRELIAGISHDLRTPLTSIKGYSKGILDGIANTDEKRERYMRTIYQKAEELESLIEILYTYSKLESGSMNFDFEEIDYIEYIQNKVKEMKSYREKNIHVSYEGIDNEEVYISIDKKQFDRIIFNIVENSSKYARKSLDDDIEVKFSIYRDDEFIYTEIRDTGPGVEEDKLDKIFEVFYRTDKARKNPSEGSGLGLSIVRRIIEGHNGSISARNDGGLVITIKLPIRRIL